jgi:hypothetical protein
MRQSRAVQMLMARMQERGTWLHIINAAAAVSGIALSDTDKEVWAMGGLVVSTLIGVLTKERTDHEWTKQEMKEMADKMPLPPPTATTKGKK